MEEPVRTSGPTGGETVSGAERSTKKGALVVPIAEIAAEEHGENAFDVGQREIIRAADAVAGIPASATGSVGPEIGIIIQCREIHIVPDLHVVIRAKEGSKIAPTARGECF